MSMNLGKAVAYLELDTSKFTKGFSSALNDLKVFGDRTATVGQKANGLSNALQKTGSSLTRNVTLPLVGVGAAAVKTAADFEQGMAEVKAISGVAGEDFKKLEDKAMEMGAKTKFSATESAEAFKYMAMAGWDANDMLNGIEGIMNLAAASGEDLAMVSDIVTDSLTAFGLSAADAAHFSDVLATASSSSNTNVALMGETFKYVAPVAGALGYSVEDTAVAIGLMANSGIKGSQAGTALRSTFTRLAKPTRQVQKAMEKYDISITNADGSMKPLNQTMLELREKFSGLTESQKASLAATIAGQEGMSGLLAIVNASEEDFNGLTEQINNAEGASEKMADTMLNTLSGSLTLLKSNLETAAIAIGNKLGPYIRRLADWISELIQKFNNLSKKQQDNIIKWGLIAAAVGPALIVLSKFIKILTTIGTGFKIAGTAIGIFGRSTSSSVIHINRAAASAAGLATQTGGLTGALTALLNPMVALPVIFGAGAIAMIAAGKAEEQRLKQLGELTGEELKLSDSIIKQKESYDNLQKSRETAIATASEEASQARSLWGELQGIVDENGRVIEGNEERANTILGLLSQALGQEITLTDGVIQNYGELSASIGQTIEMMQALAVKEALSEQYGEAITNRTTAQNEYNQALKNTQEHQGKLEEAQSKLTKLNEEYGNGVNLSMGQIKEYNEKRRGLIETIEKETGKVKNNKKAMKDAQDMLQGYNETIKNYEGLSDAIVSESAEEINKALLKVQEGFLTAEFATRESLERQSQTLSEQYEQMQKDLAAGLNGVTQEQVDAMKALVDQSTQEVANKIQEQTGYIVSQFGALGVQIPESMATAISEASPQVQEQLMTMLQTLQDGTALKGEELKALFNALGIELPTGLSNQLASLKPEVQAQGIALLTELQTAEQTKRPELLQQLRDLGIKVDDSLAHGIDSNKEKPKGQAGKVGKESHDEMGKKLKEGKLESPDVDGKRTKEGAENAAKEARGGAQGFFDRNPLTLVANIIKKGLDSVKGDGHFANGLDYVPFNNYVGILHQGERVLTKQENEQYTRGMSNGGGDVFNFYDLKDTPYEYYRAVKRAKRDSLYGF